MPTNRERADHVAAFIHEYATDYYWGTEEIDTVLGDFVSDVLHFANQLDERLAELPEHVRFVSSTIGNPPDNVMESAAHSFDYERGFGPDEETD